MNQTVNRAVWSWGDGFITSISRLKIRHPFPVPVSVLTESSVVDGSGHKTVEREDEWKKNLHLTTSEKKRKSFCT
jgi:hypothetical protein